VTKLFINKPLEENLSERGQHARRRQIATGGAFPSEGASLKRGQQNHGNGDQGDDGGGYHARVAPSAPGFPRRSHTQDGRAAVPAGQGAAAPRLTAAPRWRHSARPMAKLGCRFIAGDPADAVRLGEALYCGQPVEHPGDSYCEQHRKICHGPRRHRAPTTPLIAS
jgi:hypothetical protein